MHRRSYLATFAAVSLSGCLGSNSGGNTVGQVECSSNGGSTTSSQASAPETVEGNWPSFQYDTRNIGFNPDAAGPSTCPSRLWQFRVSPDGPTSDINYSILTPPVVQDGTLFTRDNKNTLYALDASTGSVQWTIDLPGWYIYGPTYDDGTLYLTAGRHLLAIDVKSQSIEWSRIVPSPNRQIDESEREWMGAPPAVSDGRVFVGTVHDIFCAFDATNGDLQWYQPIPQRDSTPDENGQSGTFDTHKTIYSGQPAVHDGVVSVADMSGQLYALDAETGEPLWSYQPEGQPESAPTIYDDTVFVSGTGGIYAVSLTDGTLKWRYGDGIYAGGSPAIAGNTLVAVAGDSYAERNLVGLDVRSGELRWETPAGTSWDASPSIAGDSVVIGLQSGLLAVKLTTGETLWSAESGPVTGAPVLVDDMVFTGDSDGYVYALR